MVVSPNENKQSLPVLAFSYFDPAKEQYVTLHSEPTAITVQGGAAAPAVAAQPPSSSPLRQPGGVRRFRIQPTAGHSLSTHRAIANG